MSPDDLTRLFEVFERTPRQGPGSSETTRRAFRSLPERARTGRVLDLGCGTGGSTVVLAEESDGHILAVDIHAPFLATLGSRLRDLGLAGRVAPVVADMADPPVADGRVDLVWAEGSAYAIGFEAALRRWRRLLAPRGCVVVTELTWFSSDPAEQARAFFANDYPDMRDEATRLADAREAGYDVVDSFRLPPEDWHAYYDGVDVSLREAIGRDGELDVYKGMLREHAIYRAHGDDYGYLCLILRANA